LEKVGHLSLALLAAFVPLNIIARACYQVLFQKVSEAVQQQLPIRQLLCRFMLWMVAVLAVGMAVVYFFVPQLVTVLFGAEWAESAQIIRRMYPYLLLMPVCGTICFLSDVFAKQKIAMWMEAGYVAAVAVVLFLGTRFGGFLPTISAYAWVGFTYLFIQLLWFVSLVRHYQQTLEVRSE
jgi:O-antigen/teichoic acid export membrane protein